MKNFKLAKSLIIAVLVFSAVYLLAAFVVWNINAMFWTENSRLFVAMFGPIFACVSALLSYNYCKESSMEAQTKYKPSGLCAIIATSTAAAIVFFVAMVILNILS